MIMAHFGRDLELSSDYVGDFSTYVMDVFAPEAAQIFHPAFTSPEENQFILIWQELDPRVEMVFKAVLTNRWYDDAAPFESIWVRHLNRRKDARAQRGVSQKRRWRLAGEELAVLCASRPAFIDKLAPRQFKDLIAALFEHHGFSVEIIAPTQKAGYDLVAIGPSELSSETVLVGVKHFVPDSPVGVGTIRALYGVKALHSASKVILATSAYVTKDAKREFSRVTPEEIEFKEREDIVEWCRAYTSDLLATRDVVGQEPALVTES